MTVTKQSPPTGWQRSVTLPQRGGGGVWRWECSSKRVGEAAGCLRGHVQASVRGRSPAWSHLLPGWLAAVSHHLKEGHHSNLPSLLPLQRVEGPWKGPRKSRTQEIGGRVRLSKPPRNPHTPMLFPVSWHRTRSCPWPLPPFHHLFWEYCWEHLLGARPWAPRASQITCLQSLEVQAGRSKSYWSYWSCLLLALKL